MEYLLELEDSTYVLFCKGEAGEITQIGEGETAMSIQGNLNPIDTHFAGKKTLLE